MMRLLALGLLLILLSPVQSWAARGFGATDGVGASDIVTTNYTGDNVQSSWSIWVYRTGDSASGNGRIWDRPSNHGLLYEDSGANTYNFEVPWTSVGAWTFTRPSAGGWHHILIVYDGGSTTNDPVVYVDGSSVTVTETFTPSGTRTVGSTAYSLGGRTSAADRVWNGRLAEFAVWEGTLLSSGNASSLWNSGNGARADSLSTKPTTYFAVCGTASPEPSQTAGGLTGTVTGTTNKAHPFNNCGRRGHLTGIYP